MKPDYPDQRHIPGLQRLWQEAFGDSDDFIHSFFSTAFDPRRCLCITENDTVLAAAYWFSCSYQGHPAAYIYAVATARAHRGKGLCRQLMHKIHQLLQQEQCDCAILVPGDASLARMYGAMGYRFFGGMETLRCDAGADPIALCEIGPEEFARLRQAYLMPGGVVQEGENLDFLRQHFRFYRGEGFVLTAAVEDGKLYSPELLGKADPSAVLAALDAQSGTFRMPGRTPFAMSLPLRPADAPTYFGFAFD